VLPPSFYDLSTPDFQGPPWLRTIIRGKSFYFFQLNLDFRRKFCMSEQNRITIFDTTLRDGEQSPGCSMNLEEKVKMARMLDDMGVDVIEAGFPVASRGDFEAVEAIAKELKNAVVAGLCRATKKDIEASAEAIKPAPRRRIHTFISTSPSSYEVQTPDVAGSRFRGHCRERGLCAEIYR
jgi:hypothetical protein